MRDFLVLLLDQEIKMYSDGGLAVREHRHRRRDQKQTNGSNSTSQVVSPKIESRTSEALQGLGVALL